ncbi:hypothetical protein [Gimesia algae]|uniref:Uncharacterized protein n=1 Tax=Gimesia algae TaxID=2527971 RepID=A0A517VNF6_9PLAN|nr:hypothetical protein [Gimesia algae]QDT94529.1 hypothetical protein Pan161_62250 [Gimesia algae]
MKKIDLYPALINWPFLIMGCLVGFSGGGLIVLLVIGYELIRVGRMTNALNDGVTPEMIRSYFTKDKAYHWIPWRDQVRGINEETYTKNQPERV